MVELNFILFCLIVNVSVVFLIRFFIIQTYFYKKRCLFRNRKIDRIYSTKLLKYNFKKNRKEALLFIQFSFFIAIPLLFRVFVFL